MKQLVLALSLLALVAGCDSSKTTEATPEATAQSAQVKAGTTPAKPATVQGGAAAAKPSEVVLKAGDAEIHKDGSKNAGDAQIDKDGNMKAGGVELDKDGKAKVPGLP